MSSSQYFEFACLFDAILVRCNTSIKRCKEVTTQHLGAVNMKDVRGFELGKRQRPEKTADVTIGKRHSKILNVEDTIKTMRSRERQIEETVLQDVFNDFV